MAKNQKISMPDSGSGLTMFFDDDSSSVTIDPRTAILGITILTLVVAVTPRVI